MSFLERLGRFCFRHKFLVAFFWLAVAGGVFYLAETEGGGFSNNFSLPGTESQKAFDLLEERFPAQAGDTGQIVFRADDGIESVRERMEAGFQAARESTEHILEITSPYSPEGIRQVAATGEEAGRIAYGEIQFDQAAQNLPEGTSEDIQEAVRAAVEPGDDLQVEFGGPAFQAIAPEGGREERIGLSAAVIILLLAFGSILAMLLPLFIALFGIGIGLSGLLLLANVMDMVVFAPLLASMIGIGVGIDYALFIVTRYRNGLREGLPPEAATGLAIGTAGRAVIFAGITVIISLMGMFLMELSFLNGLAVGAGLAVLVTMLASVTLLPAMIGMVGRKIDALSIYRRKNKTKPRESGFWYRWSRMIQRAPLPFAVLAVVILLVIASPVLSIRLGNQDAGNGPTELTTRRAYDLLTEAFGPGYNGPLLIAAGFDSPEAVADLQGLVSRLQADPGVARVTPPIPNDPQNPTAAIIQVYGRYAPQAEENDELVHRLRDEIIAPTAESTGIKLYSGGPAAIGIDLTDALNERLPIFFGGVIMLSFVLLMAAFRSILVPLKAALMNLLAIGAAFGVLVAVFQWGYGNELIDVDRTGPIAAFAPMLLFAILFGLSMDYEVFLLSRIKEEYDKTRDNARAVADGLATTARVITAAAAIMITVFFAFVLGNEPNAKLVGLGLAVAILLDATLVRVVLVPATMELLGDANWYLPRWLDRILPNIHIEGKKPPAVERVRPAARQTAPASDYPMPAAQAPATPMIPGTPMSPAAPVIPAAPVTPAAYPPHRGRYTTIQRPEDAGASEPVADDLPADAEMPQEADPARLHSLLMDLPFRAGDGDLRQNLEEVAVAIFDYIRETGAEALRHLDVRRLSGYLALEQRFGRVNSLADPDRAAEFLLGSVTARAMSNGAGAPGAVPEDPVSMVRPAVAILLEGIGPR